MIEGRNFVYFGPEQWESMWRDRHQLMSRLAAKNKVVYIEPRPYIEEVLADLRQGKFAPTGLARNERLAEDATGVWLYRSPRYAPLGGPPPVRAVAHALRRGAMRRDLGSLGFGGEGDSRPLVWISTPTQFDARLDLPASLRVYHIVDDYLAYHGLAPSHLERYARCERELIDWADLVIAVSPELIATKGAGNPKFHLLPNAFDARAYFTNPTATRPGALANLRRPVLGYMGLVSVRLDLALLDAIATRHPEWTLVLLGTVYPSGCEDLLTRLGSRRNVCLLPPVPVGEVPGYVRSFDLGLVPYRVTRETLHCNPLKVYEYLAAGLPVVSADVPGARQFAEVVSIASSVEEWEGAIGEALAADDEGKRAARRAAVAGHTWDARIETLSGFLRDALS